MITNKLFNDLITYFESKENPTDEEKAFLAEIKPYDDSFPISFVSRENLEYLGFDSEKITDSQMNRLADDMGDYFDENLYHEAIVSGAEYLELPRVE